MDEAPTVLPYLAPGEQGALWDPRLRGAIHGLSLSTGPGHLARGLLTGLVAESRRCLDVLGEQGIRGPVLVAGGSSSHPRFRIDLADASNRPVRVPASNGTDFSAAGAARIAALALGAEMARPAPTEEPIQPHPDNRALWEGVRDRHDSMRLALFPPTSKEQL